jgi:hypothetical protein
MSDKLKTDIALFGAAFVAIVLVLGANTNVAHLVAVVIGAQ